MVIVKLMGGLGNQMFQYAAARALAEGENIYFDFLFLNQNHTSSEHFTAREFELQIFYHLKSKRLNTYFLRFLLTNNKKYNFLKRLLPSKFKNIKYINDNNIAEFLNQPNSNHLLFLEGYFQDPSYFERIRHTLLQEFRFTNMPSAISIISDKIAKANAVSIHIRRGDYLKPNVNTVHGVLPITYYQQAVSYINESVINPVYFIFSDDPNWCKENLSFLHNKCFVSDDHQAWVDMYLMSQCKHHIIANSSFSWWGAWLNQNPEKIVITPQKWFNFGKTNIIPKEWISL